MPKSADDWVEIAEVARAHGVRGELRIRTFSDESTLLFELESIRLRHPKVGERDYAIENTRLAPGDALLLKLEGVDDRNAADLLRTAKVLARRGDFPPLDEGEFYFCDLEGAAVFLNEKPFGTVRNVHEYPTVDVLMVIPAEGGKPWEIPLTDMFVTSVDTERGEIKLHSIENCVRE